MKSEKFATYLEPHRVECRSGPSYPVAELSIFCVPTVDKVYVLSPESKDPSDFPNAEGQDETAASAWSIVTGPKNNLDQKLRCTCVASNPNTKSIANESMDIFIASMMFHLVLKE